MAGAGFTAWDSHFLMLFIVVHKVVVHKVVNHNKIYYLSGEIKKFCYGKTFCIWDVG